MLFSSEGGGGSQNANTIGLGGHHSLYSEVKGTPPNFYYPASITLSQQPMSKYPDSHPIHVATMTVSSDEHRAGVTSTVIVGTAGALSVKDGLGGHRFSDTDALHPASTSLLCRSNLKHPKEDTK